VSSICAQGEPKTAVIRFYGIVNSESVARLLNTVDAKIKEGNKRIVLLISSPGGEVFAGLTAYHYLKGVPAEVVTHNFGAVDSIATVIYCAGSKRYAVPQGRFVLHGIALTFPPNVPIEEPMMQEQLRSMQNEADSIAAVIAETTKRPIEEVKNTLIKRTVLDAEEAKKWGLVQDVRSKLYDEGADVVTIAAQTTTSAPQIVSSPAELRFSTSSTAQFFTNEKPLGTKP